MELVERGTKDHMLPSHVVCKVRTHTIIDNALEQTECSLNKFFDNSYALPNAGAGFCWIHMPVNNLAWVDVCLFGL